jgi:phosphinothricin acetyltransferase
VGRDVRIRDATEADAAAMCSLYNALIDTTTVAWTDEHETLEARLAWLAKQQRAGNPVLVAEVKDDVVGFATYGEFRDSVKWPGYRFTVENTIHVDRDHHGMGMGSGLMEALMARAVAAGKHVMVAGIDAANTGSIRFHERLGFFEVGRMPEVGEKFGQRLDLVIMQRMLDEARA